MLAIILYMSTCITDGQVITLTLPDKSKRTVVASVKRPDEDFVFNYAQMVLELGLTFKSLDYLCSIPDRERMLPMLKHAMVLFKSNNTFSKYAYEIMRLLVHQKVILSEKEAHEILQVFFQN